MTEEQKNTQEVALENIISASVQIPGVKVDRQKFLAETFAGECDNLQEIISEGPVQSGISREQLTEIANKLILKRTSQSSIASFVAGIPGGLAMAATVPADVLQFFGMALRLAQELSYLYGADDLWKNHTLDEEKVRSQLILYCGVMFGVSGAVSGVRVLTAQIAKTTLRKLPQKALTKTFWYPIVKQIGKAIGVKITKTTVSRGVSKAIPVIGGVISGGLNFVSMMPMAKRLLEVLDKATFKYTDEELEADISEIENMSSQEEYVEEEAVAQKIGSSVSSGIKNAGNSLSSLFHKKKQEKTDTDEKIEKLKKLKELLDAGIITQEEYDEKKKEILSEF